MCGIVGYIGREAAPICSRACAPRVPGLRLGGIALVTTER